MEKPNISKLSEHKRFKKQLIPPLKQIPMHHSSWVNDRLPEMLWASLVICNMNREEALSFFRFIVDFIHKNHEYHDVTLTGIDKLEESAKYKIIKHFTCWSKEVNDLLSIMLLFPELPSYNIWKNFLSEPNMPEVWDKLGNSISKTIWHQSESATDCRWVKYICTIIGKEIKFSNGIKDIDETLKGLFNYPNYGNLQHIRPFIRAGEIGLENINDSSTYQWSNSFWKFCFEKTKCVPEEVRGEKTKKLQKKMFNFTKKTREKYLKKSIENRNKIIDQFFVNLETTSINPRLETCFGLALYSISLYIELIYYRSTFSITSRLITRSLFEVLVSFKYLLQEEETNGEIWNEYRSYGTGQLKLAYSKWMELKKGIKSTTLININEIINEDIWLEFVTINLGAWNSENLNKISSKVGLKNDYDRLYNYFSGYTHANWGAVRESVYQRCINPLHRYHHLPLYDFPVLPNMIGDATYLINKIFSCLKKAYPSFRKKS